MSDMPSITIKTLSGTEYCLRPVPMPVMPSHSPSTWLQFKVTPLEDGQLAQSEREALWAFMLEHNTDAVTNGLQSFTIGDGMLALCDPAALGVLGTHVAQAEARQDELTQLRTRNDTLASDLARLQSFAEMVAGMSIWGYDNNQGQRYTECPEPADGADDSHEALMGLIEEARVLTGAGGPTALSAG